MPDRFRVTKVDMGQSEDASADPADFLKPSNQAVDSGINGVNHDTSELSGFAENHERAASACTMDEVAHADPVHGASLPNLAENIGAKNGQKSANFGGRSRINSLTSWMKKPVNGNVRLRHQESSLSEGETDQRPYTINVEQCPKDPLYLFQDDLDEGMKVGTFLHNQSCRKQSGVPQPPGSKGSPVTRPAKMGTLMGVFLPCLQNIFGVLMFIRLPFIIGTAGALESFFIVLLASSTSLLCAFSMSAIATNGVVPHGGSYFMISRSLGPELGGAVGFMFAIGQSIATGMYCVAAVEICVTYMAPQLLFADKMNCLRLYGTVVILVLGGISLLGMRLVNRFALFFLLAVLVSVAAVLIGMIVNSTGHQHLTLCILGGRLVGKSYADPCTKNVSSPLWDVFCSNSSLDSCDPFFRNQELHEELAFPGMGNVQTFHNNSAAKYTQAREYISEEAEKVLAPEYVPLYASRSFVIADVSSSFTLLLSIFFPAVTGIMAGSNRSGDLKNVQRSVPLGTLCAVVVTTSIYLLLVFCYAGSVNSLLLRDKFGKSIGGRLVAAEIAWPHPMVLLVGASMATIGAALQTLIGAPRLLLAIAKDGIIDFLRVFSVVSPDGEPRRALLVCLAIGELTVLAGSIEIIAPILSQFSLICYLFVNLACALQSLIRHPNWRPRFRFYHWLLSMCGAALAIAIMFISSWYYACIAIAMASVVYKYIDFRGAEQEWGDGWNGLALSAARYSLLRLEGQSVHVKNWRPQLLVFCRLDEDLQAVHPQLFPFASQLKAGRGLTVFASVIEGDIIKNSHEVHQAKATLHAHMESQNLKGFTDVLVANDALTGMNHLIQTAGIGALKHNTVVMCWPKNWRQRAGTEYKHWRIFLDTLRVCHAAHCALLVPKNISSFPANNVKMRGTIDVWWIVHDGGLLMLLPFLLLKTKTWKHCKMRLFTIAQLEDNSVQIGKDLEAFLYGLRINAECHVVEMGSNDISAYTYERTLLMEQRVKLLKEMKLLKRDSLKNNVQLIVDVARGSSGNIKDRDTDRPVTPKPGFEEKERKRRIRISNVTSTFGQEDALAVAEQSEEEREMLNGMEAESSVDDDGSEAGLLSGRERSPRPERAEPDRMQQLYEMAEGEASNQEGGNNRDRLTSESERGISQRFGGSKPTDGNVRRMHTAVTMNQVIKERSQDAQLVILNLPQPPKSHREPNEMNYMEFVEALTEGLQRVLLVRGAGREVVTIYS